MINILAITIRLGLLAIVCITPWLFGGVWASVQWILLAMLALLLAIDLVGRFGGGITTTLVAPAWFPLLAGVALGLFQLIPLSPQLAQWLSPASTDLRQQLTAPAGSEALDRAAGPATWDSSNSSAPPGADAAASPSGGKRTLRLPPLPYRMPRSLYTVATREYLALLVLATGAFVLASLYLSEARAAIWLCISGTVCGAALSFFGLVQRLSWNGKFYWIFEPLEGGFQSFGPFVNRNNAGGFLNLCLALGLGLLVWIHWREREPRRAARADRRARGSAGRRGDHANPDPFPPSTAPAGSARLDKRGDRSTGAWQANAGPGYGYGYGSGLGRRGGFAPREMVANYIAELDARRLGSLALVGCIAGGVLCTASRGSILAMVAAALVTAAVLALQAGQRGYAVGLVVTLLAGAGLMSWAGQTEFVQSRFALMFEDAVYESGRLPNWADALRGLPEFWGLGTGLGTYRFVYERFQQRFLNEVAHYHAENQYIQALIEGGVVALALLLMAIGLTARAVYQLFQAGGRTNTTLAVAGTFALASQVVGGAFDFGLYIPSNMLLMAVLCGAVVGRAAWLSRDAYGLRAVQSYRDEVGDTPAEPFAAPPLTEWSSVLVCTIVGILLLASLFGSLEMHKRAQLEEVMRAFPLADMRETDNPFLLGGAVVLTTHALNTRWDDAEAHRYLAELLMQLYRATTYRRLLEIQTRNEPAADAEPSSSAEDPASQPGPSVRDDELWERASLYHLHDTVFQLQQAGDRQAVQQLRDDSSVRQFLQPAFRHLIISRNACPTVPHIHFALAELAWLVPEEADDALHLQRARMLSPADATLWFWCGVLDLNAQRVDAACDSWRHSLELTDLHLDEVMQAAQGQLTVRQLLENVLPAQADILLRVAERHFADLERAAIQRVVLQRAEQALADTELPPDRKAYVTARIYHLQGRTEEAVQPWEQAIAANSGQLEWRFQLARLLLETGQYQRAYDHAVYLVKADPRSGRYERLRKQINHHRLRAGKPTP